MKIFIKSCHGSLEYDHARMFVDMGYSVGGDFDIGCPQRPKITGVTDHNSDINDYDLVVLHQTHRFDEVMREMLQAGRKVILTAFGQGDMGQHKAVSNYCREYEGAYVAAYSIKDHRLYQESECPSNKLELIRFGKYLKDYRPWVGDWPICYVSCNGVHKRGGGCGWELLEKIAQRVPVMLGGNHTHEVDFGLGELPYASLFNIYSHAQCHLSLGTVPAPLTMTLIDAFCAGTPVVAYNNGSGILEERFDLMIEHNLSGIINRIRDVLGNKSRQNELHEKSLNNTKLFDSDVIKEKWKSLIDRAVPRQIHLL